MTHIEYYHEIRNKLYHDGEGITVSEENAKNYARLAILLLKTLLDVDLEYILANPKLAEKEEKRIAEIDVKIKLLIREIEEGVARHLSVEADLEMKSLKIFNANCANLANVAKKTLKNRVFRFFSRFSRIFSKWYHGA